MTFSSPNTRAILFLCITVTRLYGQETSPSTKEEDIKILRQLVEQQSRQIETLTEQITKLNQLLESRISSTPVTQDTPPSQENVSAEAPPTTPPGLTHPIKRGETLTSIARKYNVTVEEIKNTNKIEDERKLQIDQILTIPQSPPTPETKENE